MKANVYVLVEDRCANVDVWMVGGTQKELLDYYATVTGDVVTDVETVSKDGCDHLVFDKDSSGGSARISQYKVGIVETLD